MKRKQLYKISVFLSVIGLTLMYASSQYLQPGKVKVKDIDRSQTGEVIEVEGTAMNVTNTGKHLFMDLKDPTGSIMVADFDTEVSVSNGDNLSVIGSVELYEGKLEVIARDIKKNQK